MPTVVAVVTDTHVGGSTALALPTYRTDEDQILQSSPAQRWLYDNWLNYWEYVKQLAGINGRRRKCRLIVIHLGDVIDGQHHGAIQMLSNLADQEEMACELLRPVVSMADGYYQIRGTEAHAGMSGQSEVRISRELGAKACEYELDLEIDGVLYNCAHHGRAGGRDWASSAANVAAEITLDRALSQREIPSFILRGHRHRLDDSGAKLPGVRAIGCPSWQLLNAFGYKIASGRRSDIGGLVFSDGTPDFSHARYLAAPGSVRRMVA